MSSLAQNGYGKSEWEYDFCSGKTEETGTLEGQTDGITKLLNDYNLIAGTSMSQEMIRNGAYNNNNWVSVNGVSVQITNTDKAMFVDYSTESAALYEFFYYKIRMKD